MACSPLVASKVPFYIKDIRSWGKRLNVGTSLTSPGSMSCPGVFLSNGIPLSVFREQSNFLTTACIVQDVFGTPLTSISTECPLVLLVEAPFGNKRWPLGLCHHNYLETSLEFPLYVLGSVYCIRFHCQTSNVPQLQLCLPVFSLSCLSLLSFFTWSSHCSPTPAHSPPIKSNLFPLMRENLVSLPVPSSTPNKYLRVYGLYVGYHLFNG